MSKTILIVTDTFPPEKVGSYRMNDLAANFSKDGYRITVLCPPPTFPFGAFKRSKKVAFAEFSNKVKIVHLWTWQPTSAELSKLSRVAYYLVMPMIATFWATSSKDFDVVIASSGSTPLIWLPGLAAKMVKKKRLLIDVRDLPVDSAVSLGFLQKDALITRILKIFEKKCYLSSDYVLVPTESVRKGVLANNIPQNKVMLIPNAADIDIFYPRQVKKKRQIVYAGNIGYAQDFDCVLLAMKEISKHNIQLIIIGEGEVKEQLQNQVSANNMSNYVTFTGGKDRSSLPLLLSESIAGIAPLKKLPAIEGSIPAKVFDYMACGIPFVAFGGSDLRKFAEDSGSGFVTENDPHIMASKIIFLSENAGIASEMGKKGREYCERIYNRRAMAKTIESLLVSS